MASSPENPAKAKRNTNKRNKMPILPIPPIPPNIPLTPGTPTFQDRDSPARQPFIASFSDFTSLTFFGLGTIPGPFPVPAGKRAVIEQVSVFASIAASAKQKIYVRVTITTAAVPNDYYLAGAEGLAETGIFIASSQMRCYADGGTNIIVQVFRTDDNGPGKAEVNVSGYLIDIP
jgi:hypothetical protein